MNSTRKRVPRRPAVIAILAFAASLLALAPWGRPEPDPAAALRAEAAPLARLDRSAAHALGARVERWTLRDARGRAYLGLWRPAPAGAGPRWTVVMLGGGQTGERAALLLPDSLAVNALALAWPWRGPRHMSRGELLWRLPGLRRAAMRAPAALALGIEACAREPGVDTTRIVLLGASLGVPPALAALALDPRPRALVLVDGAAGLGLVLEHELRRAGVPAGPAGPLARLAAWWIRPLEPAAHAARAADRPVLLLSARDDERLPAAAVDRLRAALPAAERREQRRGHLRPARRAEVQAVVAETMAWLDSLAVAGPVRRAAP